jgi:hypothetical protein
LPGDRVRVIDADSLIILVGVLHPTGEAARPP